ncbi:MAG: hypothetical protein QXF25_00455 [Candidatus Pacearchaeota archaeon]
MNPLPQNQNPIDRAAEIKHKILTFLEKNGPSLPIPIAREVGINSLFSSAFLSELLDEGKIKISKLKVGGSPLYFLPNQEQMLENFIRYLQPKEREALAILKEKKVLKDLDLDPSIRVALRNIKDFAFSLIIEANNEKILFWRYLTVNESEAKKIIEQFFPINIFEKLTPTKIQQNPQEITQQILNIIPKEKKKTEKAEFKEKKEIKQTDFSQKIEKNIIQSGLEILERIEAKKKDYVAKVLINSQIGKIPYLCMAKDKKKITENDFAIAIQKAQNMKLPVLFISQGTLSEKAKSYLKTWEGMIKFTSIT